MNLIFFLIQLLLIIILLIILFWQCLILIALRNAHQTSKIRIPFIWLLTALCNILFIFLTIMAITLTLLAIKF